MGRVSGGNSVGRKPARGKSFEVNVGQKKRNGDHWNVKYKNNPDEHSINVEAGGEKSNGNHWSVNYTHDIGRKALEDKNTPLNSCVITKLIL